MPKRQTVYDWLERVDGLSVQFARAREAGCDAMAEEALIIANTPILGRKKVFSSGADDGEDSMTVTEEDMLGHRKLQIETRLKLLAKFNPKKYGEYKQPEERVDPSIIDVEVKNVMDVAIKRLELLRVAE